MHIHDNGLPETQFEKGDVIKWCGEQYTVVENFGNNGTVKDASGQLIFPFYWKYDKYESEIMVKHVQQN